jgi:hypothetical protein
MILVDPKTGKRYDVPDAEVETATTQHGLVDAVSYEAEQRSGGFGSQLATAGEEAIRQTAAVIPGVDAGAAPAGLTELEPGQAGNPLTDVYSPEARERRQVNPTAAALGGSAPVVAAGALLPGAGAVGVASTLGLDVLSGYAQEAVDAELENRDIRGEDVLRNVGLNAAFSLGGMGLAAGARAAARGGRNLLELAADKARQVSRTRAAASEGAELAEAVGDTAVRDDLLQTLADRAEEAVSLAETRLGSIAAPRVANNPNAQRSAVEAVVDAFEKTDPTFTAALRPFMKGSGAARLRGLRELRATLNEGSDLANALDGVLSRADLWGDDALRAGLDVESALKLRPGPDATPDQLLEFASAVRGVREGEFAGLADQIEQLAERSAEVRTAAALGGAQPAARAPGTIDYRQAMKDLDPTEAWRLTKDGADEGMRRVEAATVSDALQRVDDTLKEDVAMSVKRSDFVQGAEKWSAKQVEKQDGWVQERWLELGELLDDVGKSKGSNPESGYALGGFAADAERLLNTSMPRIAQADPITRNFELDQLKRGLDGIAKRIGGSRNLDQASKAFGTNKVLTVANKLREGLESAELFGRNAGLQVETNAAWKKLIDPYSRVRDRMSQFLGREFGNIGVDSGRIIRFDADMVERAMGAYNRNFRKDLDAAIAGLDQMMKARQTRGLSHLDALAAARADLMRVRDGFEFADLLRVAKSRAKEPALATIAKRATGGIAGAVSGGALAGAPGAILGAAVGTGAERALGSAVDRVSMLKPGSKSGLNAALRRHLGLARDEQARLLGDAAFSETLPEELRRQLLATGADARAVELAQRAAETAQRDRSLTARLMVNPDAAARFLRVAGDIGSAVVRFQGEHETLGQAYDEATTLLDGFEKNPERMLELFDEEFGAVGQVSSKLHTEMAAKASQVYTYLQAHRPGRRNVSVVYPKGTPASQAEMRMFAKRYTAAVDPASVHADARAGRLEKVQVDTLQALWPREYDALRAGVLQELGTGKASTNIRQRMSILFGFGSEIDPALGPRTRAVVAAARAEQDSQRQSAPAPRPPASGRMPSTQTLTPGGMSALQLGQQLTF